MRATWLPVARAEAEGEPHVVPRLVAGVALAVARRLGVRLPDGALLSAWGEPIPVDVPDGVVADAWLPGEVLEALLPAGERRRRGSHHTPRHVARTVTGLALADDVTATSTVCDPAVGGGAFLLAAAEVLAGRGGDRAGVVRRLSGVDIDPVAVAVTEVALCLWARGRAVPSLGTCDALARPADGWGEPASFVLGNPPFLGQLRSATARRRGGTPGCGRTWRR